MSSVHLTPVKFEDHDLAELLEWLYAADSVAAEMGVTVEPGWRADLLAAILRRWWRDEDDRTLIRLWNVDRHQPRGLEEELRTRGFEPHRSPLLR